MKNWKLTAQNLVAELTGVYVGSPDLVLKVGEPIGLNDGRVF